MKNMETPLSNLKGTTKLNATEQGKAHQSKNKGRQAAELMIANKELQGAEEKLTTCMLL